MARSRWLAVFAFLAACTTNKIYESTEKPSDVVGTIVGRVTSLATGLPLPGVAVSTLTPAGAVSAASDATGAFSLGGLPAGATYEVRFDLSGYVPRLAQVELPSTAGNVALANPVATANATLAAADASVAGTVTGGGQPLSGAVVTVDLRPQGFDLVASAATDASGAFRLDGLPSAPTGLLVTVAVAPYDGNADGVPEYQGGFTFAMLYSGLVTRVGLDLHGGYAGFQVVVSDVDSGIHAADTPLHVTFSKALDVAATGVSLRDSTLYLDVAVAKALDAGGTVLAVSAAGGTPLAEGHQYYLTVNAVSATGERAYYAQSFAAGAGGAVIPAVTGLAASPAIVDYDTRSFALSWDAVADAAGYRVYARDTRANPSYLLLTAVGSAPAPAASVVLPIAFDYYSGDFLQTPFAWGTKVDFAVVAGSATGAFGDVAAAVPLRVADAVAPLVTGTVQSGSARNDTTGPQTVSLLVMFDEYMDPAVAPAIALPVAGLNPTFAMDRGLRKGTFTLTVPASTDATGAFTLTGARDTSGNPMRAYTGRLYQTQQLVSNGTFETGNLSGWTTSASGTASVPVASDVTSASGAFSARMGNGTGAPESGTSTLWQDVALPAGSASIKINVSYRPFSSSSSAGDRGWCGVYAVTGGLFQSVFDVYFLQNTSSFATATAQLTPALAGQTVRLQCSVQQYGSYASGMYLDDVSVVAQY